MAGRGPQRLRGRAVEVEMGWGARPLQALAVRTPTEHAPGGVLGSDVNKDGVPALPQHRSDWSRAG